MYSDEATVALVGHSAAEQFRNVVFSVDELSSGFPFICFDSPSQRIYDWIGNESEIERVYKEAAAERVKLCKTDLLFVLSELESREDITDCLLYAEQLKDDGLSFFVTHEKNRTNEAMPYIASKFSHIIFSRSDDTNIFLPVKQLLIDYYRPSYVGVDMADAFSVFPRTTKMFSFFSMRSYANIDEMIKNIPEMLREIDVKSKQYIASPDFMIFLNIPANTGLEKIADFITAIADPYPDASVIWSNWFDFKNENKTCTLLLQTIFPQK